MSRDIVLPDSFDAEKWLSALSNKPGIKENHAHFWGNDPNTLSSFSTVQFLTVGTGLDIYTSTLLSAIEAAEHEVILVTCFWALSDVLSLLCASLIRLSQKALARRDGSRVRVKLCFSSMSRLQMLLHTSSKRGHVYQPAEWSEKLGLPHPNALEGLDLVVKTLFFRPFSVMHPKFVITDRRQAFLLSCNISCEVWLECCVSVIGPVVDTLIKFWHESWAMSDHVDVTPDYQFSPSATSFQQTQSAVSHPTPQSATARAFLFPTNPISTILLPSPHHNSLILSFPFLTPPPPQTPLNTLLLHVLGHAEQSIKLITPNLTSPPVISALMDALYRGVDVYLMTNRRMMIIEQLVTAGTITEVTVRKLVRKYKQLRQQHYNNLEEGRALGSLRIEYFRPIKLQELGPMKVHIKCATVDGKIVVFGSGNMDRASWYTSQELGIALFREDAVRVVWEGVQKALKRRTEEYFIGMT